VAYRWLDTWAETGQRRFDERHARAPREPGTEPLFARILTAIFGTVATAMKLITIPVFVAWTIAMIAQHTIRSLVLAVALMMLTAMFVGTGVMLIQNRRENNVVTGLARRRTQTGVPGSS
jgi:hypothetical protein